MNQFRLISNCCTPCRDPNTINIPGAKGDPGESGLNGSSGINAFATILAGAVQPGVMADVTLSVSSTLWMVAGQVIVIGTTATPGFMGHYEVISILSASQVSVRNLGYPTNAIPGTLFAIGMTVAPSGRRGMDAAFSGIIGSEVLAAGNSAFAIAAPGADFGFWPSALVLTIRKPGGGMNFFGTVDTLANTGFNLTLNGVIPAAGYAVDYLALP